MLPNIATLVKDVIGKLIAKVKLPTALADSLIPSSTSAGISCPGLFVSHSEILLSIKLF